MGVTGNEIIISCVCPKEVETNFLSYFQNPTMDLHSVVINIPEKK